MTFEEIQAVYLVMKELNGTPLSGDFGFVIYSGLAEIGTVTSEDGHVKFKEKSESWNSSNLSLNR